MPISSALLEAVLIEYNRDFGDESTVQRNETPAPTVQAGNTQPPEETQQNSDNQEEVPPEMVAAECLLQLAWSCYQDDEEEDSESEQDSDDVPSDTAYSSASDEHPEELMFPWYEEVNKSFHLDEFLQLASATPSPKRKYYEVEVQPCIKRRRLRF